uniref:NADH dehydrogenase subunit 6 n=1 Tax=Cipangopaludina ussuriensis TaxID=2023715 RepID=A0A222YT11_CIPUS|nr:NADH dehydrogenase subunit 6 [Cipangopaludina ussuriensis]ASR74855.1 NADH dehydrogenase subunit 6 [Cipangopaludina ussuriensis]
MTMLILSSFCFTFCFMIPLMAQPLSLGFCIMMLTLLMCMLIGVFLSSWYGFILFLIYVGGLLVMFAYVVALIPNILMNMDMSIVWIGGMQVSFMYMYWNSCFVDMKNLNILSTGYMMNVKMSSIELVSPEFISILISLGIILLINMIVVVKICYYKYSVMRPFLNI